MADWNKCGWPRVISLVTVLAAVSGCSKDIAYNAPMFSFLGSYKSQKSEASVLLDNVSWWEGLNDPVLNTLVNRALRQNLDLDLAKERVVESRANVKAVPGSASLNSSVGVNLSGTDRVSIDTRAEGTLGFAWLFDPYGARRAQVEAAKARVEVADAEQDAAQLLVLLNLSNAYIDLVYFQRLLQMRRHEIQSRKQTLDLTHTLMAQGSATRLDVVRAEARLSAAEAAIPAARSGIQRQKYQIAVLLGQAPGTLDINLDGRARLPRPTLSSQVGIPADLLRNRPDIRIAERLYYASLAEVTQARADLYPRLSLGGPITLASTGGATSGSYSFGPSLQLPSLPAAPTKAAIAARESRARQAHTSWKSAVLDSIFEVESSLVDYSGAKSSVGTSQKTVRLYREAVELTREIVLSEGATIQNLLDAEESVTDAELLLADNQRQLARSFVRLNVALGSGNAHDQPPEVEITQ